ncbi:unnamed protein product [Chironomus riparius]|uniref:Midasin n=1 Tax=Chironomus riparius TaxID=315576 RepID=A0A9N9RXD9_9DIPT|nr:unnamed protein product [Chironomus riparius]
MSINTARLKMSLTNINKTVKSSEINGILAKKKIQAEDVDDTIKILCDLMIKNPETAFQVRQQFQYILFPIVCSLLNMSESSFVDFQIKSIILSILAEKNSQILGYSRKYFNARSLSPFVEEAAHDEQRKKKMKLSKNVTDLQIVSMGLRFLQLDACFYRRIWDWSSFIELFSNKGCDLQKLYCNKVTTIIFAFSNHQTELLNNSMNISEETCIEAEIDITQLATEEIKSLNDKEVIDWKYESDIITDIEGVYLPIYNKSVVEYYQDKLDIVKVDSTSVNLRSLALGVSSGKAVCLCGHVGSGKTTLVEYLAKRVGRLSPKLEDFNEFLNSKKEFNARQVNGNKRKIEKSFEMDGNENLYESGFLRIQLGDQTDSKVLLGQYRCTDIPGEFVWQPGVLTQAVMNGHWLLLEDIDTATQDVCAILTNLLENNFLRVPGFRENLKVAQGFQLFLTLRTHKMSNQSTNSAYSLLEKHLYTINMLPLSRKELSTIICQNYPKLASVSSRIVDVFLIFSRGCHTNEIEYDDIEMLNGSKAVKKENNDNDSDDEGLPYANKYKLNILPTAGRMVSTRDLLKLCKRSSLTFKATSSECAYLVFQNCVDLFSSHLSYGELKTNLIISIGARLGIIETRCIHLANEYKPMIKMTTDEIVIGRETVLRHSKELVSSEKKVKISDEDDVIGKNKVPPPTFSFTRVSSCILERIAVACQQNEPILLVGETGTGKTSAVQYLAYQTNHNLVVVNMNNQSDVSDLIGGFKPVDMQFIVSPLRNDFENLFARTFDVLKNEKFLSHVASCINRGDYSILIKLMLKVISNAYKILQDKKNDSDFIRWQNLEKKLKKLDQQLKHSVNLSFAFITGSLVNCIKNGDWVLLDEINLASTETLECLSTILEADGSIILLERGDFVPIKRHPNFRIFACMNPSTDVGKKDLSVGIRNRFTEFFVDELTVEKDLLILVGDYLSNTGIEKSRIHKAVQLYMELRNLSQLELNDGLGNKPVFSLRTLCRALRTCAKNLCGSTERNLYESFCLSFLTQLDSQSHNLVLQKIQSYLVSNVKKILSQQIPKPPIENVMNFEGFWIEQGDKELSECKEYIMTESVQKNLKDLARIISIGKLPILIQGPTSAGKTSLIEYIARRSGNHCLRINNHEHTDLQEYVGTYVADVSGKLSFQEGVLVQAMRNGYWIILDELNLAPSDILEALNRVLDDNRELYIPETQVLVKAHPNFMLFATQNPPGLYGGRKTLSRAFKNRFIELHFSEIPKKELEVILEKRCMIPMSYAQKMVKTMSTLQVNRRTTTRNNFTLRDLFRWGNRYTFADNSLLGDRNYDWNQHLVDEGYLVLSAKVRNQTETDIIVETLKKNFSKNISIDHLFTLSDHTSKVTKSILETLISYKGSQNVVWTFEMRRMAVMVSKSLQFNEPVLLVGPTGCGKTTVCQLLSELHDRKLRILNCHMHTESADFIGGLRPCREAKESENSLKLFEWSDGPLIFSMIEGSYFLADEISLAEDSVLERLNCVLEPERKILLAEKGGVNENVLKKTENSEFVIKASDGFQFFATMNPGGDFGKKELSPALRNRFTEIWCTAMYSDEDLMKIAVNIMEITYKTIDPIINKIAEIIVKTVNVVKQLVEKLNFSIRDILAYVNYITQNHNISNIDSSNLDMNNALHCGLKTIFLDSLEMLPYENVKEIASIRDKAFKELHKNITEILESSVDSSTLTALEESQVTLDLESFKFGINPFYLDINHELSEKPTTFTFTAPTTKQNLFRVLSAMSLKKAILLEGPPGVGKSSLIENISSAIGYNLVRINLCEHTDIADLFGTDLPVESSIFENDNNDVQLGSFMWRDGPLLAALKSPNTWILLDELNLAPQSVLEGLNAILDHRGEVFITELNKTFKLGQSTRIFATQNPLRQGGGRKGLPQSFLNRFTKVYLRKLEKTDLSHVVSHNFKIFDEIDVLKEYKLIDKMVTFSERIESGISNLEFGFKGGPFEANLRDMLRWCEFVTNKETGFDMMRLENTSLNDFQLVLFEKMKLVYCERMRTEHDVENIVRIFCEIFEADTDRLEKECRTVGFYWNDSNIFFNDVQCKRKVSNNFNDLSRNNHSVILSSQLNELKSITECVLLEKPILLCGPTDCGKTKIIDAFCELYNEELNFDTIDDSVTGSFQQFDFNRMLEEVWKYVEEKLLIKIMEIITNVHSNIHRRSLFTNLYLLWRDYDVNSVVTQQDDKFNEVEHFCKRLDLVKTIIDALISNYDEDDTIIFEEMLKDLKIWRNFLVKTSATLNTGGHFVWIDSMIVKSIKFGNFICLEHVNLVSSAILDRLNPILEPNGSLMIAEKGVDDSNQPETISKHKNFRVFLTTDPKFGEVSRAMRNRCIELSLSHQLYTEDDLRKLIYLQGVHDMYLIKAILDIHKGLNSLSDYSTFGVSHLIKMAFLVSQNKSMGLEDRKCLILGALEVYVRSSNIDLLGFGLSFYKSKLRQQILDAVNKLKSVENLVNYKNLIIHSNELSEMTMIKFQAEGLLSLLRCCEKDMNFEEVLDNLHTKITFNEIKDPENIMKYLLTFLYMLSTFSDVHKRKIYLNKMITSISKASTLNKLNENLYKIVKELANEIQPNLPWNSKMFSRLRPYNDSNLDSTDQFRITMLLIFEMTLEDIHVGKSIALKDIDSVTYSRAVQKKSIADTVNNKMLTELYNLLGTYKSFLDSSFKTEKLNINEKMSTDLILSFLWFNRLLSTSTQKLFHRNNVKTDLLDELYLHFKWLGKHCINYLTEICTSNMNHVFMTTYNEIQNYILGSHHTLQICKKIYVKNFASFLPFYKEEQIKKLKEGELLNALTSITPNMNELLEFNEFKCRLLILLDTKYQKIRRQVNNNKVTDINELFESFTETFNDEIKESNLYESWNDNINNFKPLIFEDRFCIEKEVSELKKQFQNNDSVDLKDVKYNIEVLPIFEYFLMRILSIAVNGKCVINDEYPINVPSIDSNTLALVKIISDKRYSILQNISEIVNSSNEFKKKYSSFKMAIDSTINESVHKSTIINSDLCRSTEKEEIYSAVSTNHMFVTGGLLTYNLMSLLMGKNGEIRQIGLGEVHQWKIVLNGLQNMLWMNAEVNTSNYDLVQFNLKKNSQQAEHLLMEIDVVKDQCQSLENENYSDFNQEFWNLLDYLKTVLAKEQNDISKTNLWLQNYTIQSLCSVMKLNLISYFPLIDPVKKNVLKTKYVDDDIDHLNKFLFAYQMMSTMLEYENLGRTDRESIEKKVIDLHEKHMKYSKKTALRPDVCSYSSMVRDINHFLTSFCHPKQFHDLLRNIDNELNHQISNKSISTNQLAENMKIVISDLISKLDLWIVNADKFLGHTLRNYNKYYRDFTAPIHYCITSLKDSLLGLKSLLKMKHDSIQVTSSGIFWNCNENEELSNIMKELIEFPAKSHESFLMDATLKNHFFSIIESIENGENLYFEMIKSNIQEVTNTSTTVYGKMTPKLFEKFDHILNICNQLWQKQEELKAKRQAEEDSLYVTKTKCKEDDEEVVKMREIAEMFPDNAENDFNDFIQQDTLEQTVEINKPLKDMKDIITERDFKLIGDFFMSLMDSEHKTNEKDVLKVFNQKMKIFNAFLERFKTCLECSIDKDSYKGMSLLVGYCQSVYDDMQITDNPSKIFDFYTDSNVQEALTCISVMEKLEKRVNVELEQWPDHAVLNDLIILINRIRGFSCNSSLVRFNVGLQILRKKVYEWNSVAHKLNNFKDIEHEIAEIIQRWMRMELQCWRESLKQSQQKVEAKSYRYWFFLYNLIHEYLQGSSKSQTECLVDFNSVEKRFGKGEILEQKPQQSGEEKISLKAVTNVLKQFIESSSYGEFALRMNLLKSFKCYLIKINEENPSNESCQIIALLHNIHQYFTQFSNKVQEMIDFMRKPIEDKLKKFVKINSFNKDLSYFGTESSIKQVHRNLHKFLKEFEVEISKKISDLFIYKDSGTELDLNLHGQVASNALKLETFIGTDVIEKEQNSSEVLSFSNINNFILKSRTLVSNLLSNVQYPKLVENLEELIKSELDRCNQLRALKVDENFPRNKQKSQAKSILNQKRKALSDFFKTMMNIGINYKSGLLTESLNPEMINLQIYPFSSDQLEFSNIEYSNSVNSLHQKLDIYFNKSIFKIKLLRNILLVPRSDMDMNFIERIKGIAIELFNLVQDERMELSNNVNMMINLKQNLRDIETATSTKNSIFENEFKKFSVIKNCFVQNIEVLEQVQILLKCAPKNEESKELKVLVSTNNVLHKKSQIYGKIVQQVNDIIIESNASLKALNIHNSRFVNGTDEHLSKLKGIIKKLDNLKQFFVVDSEYSIYGSPVIDLIALLNLELEKINEINKKVPQSQLNINSDLESLSHMILLAIQNIFKEYRTTVENIESNEAIEENHLKEKLHKKLLEDIKTVNLKKINEKLSEVMNKLFTTSVDSESLEYLSKVHPLIKQYKLLADYFIIQHISANKVSSKMLSITLSVFLELAKNGFCIPEHLLSDEEQKEENDSKTGEGFGFEDGDGEKDVSDKLESKDQLDEARKPDDYNKDQKDNKECKEEKGIDMSDNFEGQMHDVSDNESNSDGESNKDENEEMDKEMGDTKEGADKLDDQIWGSDEEKENEQEEQDKKDETGKGSDEQSDKHNDLDAESDQNIDNHKEQQEGLDAASQMDEDKNKQKQKQKQDIDQMNDEEGDDDQTNPYHNDLDEPPEPEDFDLNDDMNLDSKEQQNDEQTNEENPFDIDKMKEQAADDMDGENDEKSPSESNENPEENPDMSDSENDTEKMDTNVDDENPEEINDQQENPEDQASQQPGLDENNDTNEKENELPNEFQESKDKKSKEENIQSMPNQKDQKSSFDQVQIENMETNQQENEIDDQDTGEDKDGIGQAENKESETGHQGVSETKESKSNKNRDNDNSQQKRRKGNTDEERTLGSVDDLKKKFLKTIDKINQAQNKDENDDNNKQGDDEDEYQHVKDAKKSDKTTMDNATEEQSKEIKHEENFKQENHDLESNDQLMDDDKIEPEIQDITEEINSKKLEENSNKPAKNSEQTKDRLNDQQNQETVVDGENVMTSNVSRGTDTTAHCQMDIINDSTMCEEQSNAEELEIRKQVESELMSQKVINPDAANMDNWQKISNQMVSNARELCEQLRLILEPTKCTRLKGDYRTGRRINMKKIIPYIASQFRKDKIWLRRTKAAQRDYKITIAVDDSKSMDHNNSKELTLQTISLVSQALTLLESGKLSVVSFGEACSVLLKYNDQFNGPKLVNSLNFDQNKTRIADLLDFTRVMNQEDASSSNALFEHLMIVLSDGRNIFSEGEKRVKNAIKMARLQRMFLIYIIIDNPDNKDSILDIRTVLPFTATEKTTRIVSYMDNFPFPYYVIVRDLNQLPVVLSEGLRQWFELVNSEQ